MDRYSWFLQWIDLFDRRHTWRALATQLPRKNLKNLGFFVTSFDESENSLVVIARIQTTHIKS
jgi:hypothetical protein